MEITSPVPLRTEDFIQNETQIHIAPTALFVPASVETIYTEATEILKYNPDKTDSSNGEEPFLSFEEHSVAHDRQSIENATKHLKLHETLEALGLERIANRDAWLSSDLINKILMEKATIGQRRLIKSGVWVPIVIAMCIIVGILFCVPFPLDLTFRVFGIIAAVLSTAAGIKVMNISNDLHVKYFSKYGRLKLEDMKERIIPVNLLSKMLSLKKEIPEIEFTLEVPNNALLSFNEKREYARYRLNIGSEIYYFKES